MSMVRGVIVGHGALASALLGALEQIAGAQRQIEAISNSDCDRGTLEERILAAVADGPAIVFIDMPSGSCMFAAMRRLQSVPHVRVVTGVNLAMLLDFVFHRDGDVDELATRVADAGVRAVAARK